MKENKSKSQAINYALTFFSVVLLFGCFATHLVTGKPALVQFDSLAGSVLLGVVFILFAFWLVYDDHLTKQIPLSQAIAVNLKSSTFICIILYWLILVIIPAAINLVKN